jgi:hypothetical protein
MNMQMQRRDPGLWDWFCRGMFAGFLVAYSWLVFQLWKAPDPARSGADLAIVEPGDAGGQPGERSALLGLPIASQRAKKRPARRNGEIL